jgi:preprotein translocase subunit SecG
MQAVLLVIQFLIAIALIGIILIQRTSQDGGGLMGGGGGGGTMGGLFTARGSANLLTKTTAILATLFIINSLALGFIASHTHQNQNKTIMDIAEPGTVAPETIPEAPKAPEVPVAH